MRLYFLIMAPFLVEASSECIPIAGERIHAADLAQKLEIFARMSPDVEIGFAPLPGARRLLSAAELQRAAARNGLSEGTFTDVCVQMSTQLLRADDLANALQQELRNQGFQDANLEILDFSKYPVPEGKLEFLKSGLPPQKSSVLQPVLWRGRIVYGGSRSVPIWARVRVFIEADVVLAAKDIASASTIAEGDLVIEKRRLYPAVEPRIASTAEAIGKRAKRSFKKGDMLAAALLECPKEIERGDKVDVLVSSGLAQLRLDAIAETSGQIGERIMIRNPSSGKRFQATVESKGHVRVETSTEEKQ